MKKTRKLFSVNPFFYILIDLFLINAAVCISILFRFDFSFTKAGGYVENFLLYMPIHSVITILVFIVFQLYSRIWKHAGFFELAIILFACTTNSLLHYLGTAIVFDFELPLSCYLLNYIFSVIFVAFIRFSFRISRYLSHTFLKNKVLNKKRIMIVGAGTASEMLIKEIESDMFTEPYSIACVIDDDPSKIGKFIRGIKIVGDRNSIIPVAELYKIDEIIFAIHSISEENRSLLLSICGKTKCVVKTLPRLNTLSASDISFKNLQNVAVEDLLGRDPIKIDLESIIGYIKGSVILVTGGGGSIGSELCRQISAHEPKKLIIFDVYENNVYDIVNELKRKYHNFEIIALIGSVRDENRILQVMEKHLPEIVFHAAAHKHVPLMEDSPNEAVKNNVFGTLNTVKAAEKTGVRKFVLISTDKAVNPTNIMGATKRICEMIIQSHNRSSKTEFVAVRFGNVLGSNGSVVPLFKRQIEEGGPVTVTHPDIIRYFMTISEAVSLVLQAGALAKGGEIFIFDMGKPVKIVDLAENLIRCAGLEPGKDIKIEFSGLRPGEKLYEELLLSEEGIEKTANDRIYIGKPIDFDANEFMKKLEALRLKMYDETVDISKLIESLIPNFTDNQNRTKTV